jgi:hypothetical protein
MIYLIDTKGGRMRTLIDIPEDDLKLMSLVAKKLSISRAEFVRQAVATSLAPHRQKMNHQAFGSWPDFREDGLEYQERIRAEW